MLAIGLPCGLLASILFNVGIALQALEARSTPAEEGLHASLLVRLLRRPRWVVGLLLGGLGVVFEVIAFANAPFVVVEPLLSAGRLVLLAIGARDMGEKPGVGTVAGVLAIIAGTALIAWGAPEHSEQHRGPLIVVVVMAALVAVSLVPFAVRGGHFDTAIGANLGSACGFAATNVATKLMADNIGADDYPRAVAWIAVAAFAGVAATISAMTALQRRPATTVVPISTAVQTFLPIALEPLFLTENWREAELDGLVLLAGLVVMVLGTVLVSRGCARSARSRRRSCRIRFAAAARRQAPRPPLGQQFFRLLLRFFDAFFDLFLRFFDLLLAAALAVFELFLAFFDPLFGRFLAFFDPLFGLFPAFFDPLFGRFDALFSFPLGVAGRSRAIVPAAAGDHDAGAQRTR